MNNEVRIALAVAGGYLLGRRQKLRLAMALAAAGATGRLSSGQGDLLQQGLKVLSSSPELAKITESIRGDLVDASKAAAKAAVSRQIDSLSTRLHDRAESLRNPLEDLEDLGEEPEEGEEGEEPKGRRGRIKGILSRRKARRHEEDEEEPETDEEEQDEEEQDEDEEEEEEEAPPVRRRPAPSGRRGAAKPARKAPRDSGDEEDEADEEEDEEEKPRPKAKRRPPSRSGSASSRSKPTPARARG
ncbi:hypothetical protein AB0G15_39700 [Streptosporangium sp. NPDC023825]|uniref:hypothetical protein n=1 Tax=Streptosporangium sp. NPDC023825 TaxID=3154909 RepID=UPI0034425AE4